VRFAVGDVVPLGKVGGNASTTQRHEGYAPPCNATHPPSIKSSTRCTGATSPFPPRRAPSRSISRCISTPASGPWAAVYCCQSSGRTETTSAELHQGDERLLLEGGWAFGLSGKGMMGGSCEQWEAESYKDRRAWLVQARVQPAVVCTANLKLIPLMHSSSSLVLVGTIWPPGHMQKEYTPRLSSSPPADTTPSAPSVSCCSGCAGLPPLPPPWLPVGIDPRPSRMLTARV
jgi:hypothetical protein